MKPVLFYVVHPSHFRVLSGVARLLERTGRGIVVVFDADVPFAPDVEASRAAGWRVVDPRGGEPAAEVAHPSPDEGRRDVLRPFRRLLARSPLAIAPQLRRHRSRIRAFRKLLDAHDPALVLLPGDSVSYHSHELIRSAHDRGIRAGIVPFTVSNADEVVADLKRDPAYRLSSLENRFAAWLYPKWAIDHRGERLIRMPGFKAIAMEWSGAAPAKPWVLHSGNADSLAAESPWMLDHYVREGLPVERYRLVGSLADDTLAAGLADSAARKQALEAELDLPAGRPLFVFAVSNWKSYFVSGNLPADFPTFEALTRFWSDTFASITGWNTVLSLHPSMRAEEWSPLERRPNVAIARRPIEELVPLSDVFVSSISATVRMALACGKPVVDHDPFRFRYGNFAGIEGVTIVEEAKDFQITLVRLATDGGHRERAREAIRANASRYGMLDGKVADRMLAWVEGLASAGGARA